MTKHILTVSQLSGNVVEDNAGANKNQRNCLRFLTAQKMINRLLTCDRIKTALDEGKVINHWLYNDNDNKLEIKIGAFAKKELAKKLSIKPKELEKLKSPDFYNGVVNKISLPLVRLYCAIKFVADGKNYADE